jgi:hypothetical protein
MRCGNPGEVPCRKALKQSPTPAAEPDQTGPEKIRPPGTGAVFKHTAGEPRIAGRMNTDGASKPPRRTQWRAPALRVYQTTGSHRFRERRPGARRTRHARSSARPHVPGPRRRGPPEVEGGAKC